MLLLAHTNKTDRLQQLLIGIHYTPETVFFNQKKISFKDSF